ncbi:hypothetical protein D3C84_381940 [compost metagenome]
MHHRDGKDVVGEEAPIQRTLDRLPFSGCREEPLGSTGDRDHPQLLLSPSLFREWLGYRAPGTQLHFDRRCLHPRAG